MEVHIVIDYKGIILLAIILLTVMVYMEQIRFKIIKNIDKNCSATTECQIKIKFLFIQYENTIYFTTNKREND